MIDCWTNGRASPGRSTSTDPVDRAWARQRTFTCRISGHNAGESRSWSLSLLLLVLMPALLRTLSIRVGSLAFSFLSFLPRFWSFESIYLPISFANAFESLAVIVFVVPNIWDISIRAVSCELWMNGQTSIYVDHIPWFGSHSSSPDRPG